MQAFKMCCVRAAAMSRTISTGSQLHVSVRITKRFWTGHTSPGMGLQTAPLSSAGIQRSIILPLSVSKTGEDSIEGDI